MGHRIAKHVLTSAGVLEKSTYYVLDAQGNVMSTYERAINDVGSSVSYTQTEKHIYGASRLGVHTERIELLGTQNETYSMTNIQHHIGYKTYELTNHLGNVLSVISDKIVSEENPDAPATQNSVYFDGVNDYGVTASFAAGLGTDISMECWVKTTTSGSTQILGTYYIAGSGIGLDRGANLILTSTGKVSMDGRNGTGVYRSSGASTSSVNDGNWHHVAGTVSGGSWKIYVDGTLESSATVTAGNFSGMNQPFYIGRSMYGAYYQGNLREMSVWNYEKTGTQINSDMGTVFTGSETGLVGYWPMTNASVPGNDVSTANRDATMTNGPVPSTDPVPAVYLADIRQSTDYSPFGVILYKRDYRLADSATTNLVARGRYGYQGSEMDNELKQDGNSYNTFFRQLDPRLGRWLSIDPKMSAWESPYASMGNNPVRCNDPFGDKFRIEGSREERREVRRIFREGRRNSPAFKVIYKELKKEKDVHVIRPEAYATFVSPGPGLPPIEFKDYSDAATIPADPNKDPGVKDIMYINLAGITSPEFSKAMDASAEPGPKMTDLQRKITVLGHELAHMWLL